MPHDRRAQGATRRRRDEGRPISRGTRPSGGRGGRRGPSRGQALAELALVAPVMLLLFAAALDLGRLFHAQITIAGAAREGALEAAANPDSYAANQDCDTGTNRVVCRVILEASHSTYSVAPGDVELSCTPAPCPATPSLGDLVRVTVRGHFSMLTPVLAWITSGQPITLSSSAVAQLVVGPQPGALPSPTPAPSSSASPSDQPSPAPSPTPSPTPACARPTARFSVNPTSGFAAGGRFSPGTTFGFTDESTNLGGAACNPVWSWSFGDGSGASSAQNPTYVYSRANTRPGYTVRLVVSNLAGSSTASVIVPVYASGRGDG